MPGADDLMMRIYAARALTERGIPAPRGGIVRTHTTVARVLARAVA